MNHWIFMALYVLWCAVAWRLRGGALTTLTGIDLGTDFARVLCAIMVTMPLVGPVLGIDFWLPICVLVGLLLAGWGPFQGMGLAAAGAPEASWLRWLPLRLSFKVGTFWHDFVGMAEAGLVCMFPCVILAAFYGLKFWFLLASGVAFAPAYALARLNFPTIPKFAAGQAWGEVFTGAAVGAGLFVVFSQGFL